MSNESATSHKDSHTDVRQLTLRYHGMFSNVNEVIQQLHMAKTAGYEFVIDWSESCYRSPEMSGNPWNYYFEDCFSIPYKINTDAPKTPETPYDVENIIAPSALQIRAAIDRQMVSKIIFQHIRPKSHIQKIISGFHSQHFDGEVIGLHIRGPTRLDGVGALRSTLNLQKGIPYKLYFSSVDKYLNESPDAKIFICSDSQMVIDEVHRRYGARTFWYDSLRSKKGEMHVRHETFFKSKFNPYTLGEDVLVEAELLSKCTYLVHGVSNVVQYVLCKSPHLPNLYAYGDTQKFDLSKYRNTSDNPILQLRRIIRRIRYGINRRSPWNSTSK